MVHEDSETGVVGDEVAAVCVLSAHGAWVDFALDDSLVAVALVCVDVFGTGEPIFHNDLG